MAQRSDMSGFPAPPSASITDPDVWRYRILAAGGRLTSGDFLIGRGYYDALSTRSFFSKIPVLIPWIGDGVIAHSFPLLDTVGLGRMRNVGFVDADCTTRQGCDNSVEAAKYWNARIWLDQVGAGSSGGLFWWERNLGLGSGVEPIGCYDSAGAANRYVLDLRSSIQRFRWGSTALVAGPGTTATNGFYLGQRNGPTLREIYKDDATLGSPSTTSDPAANIGVSLLYVFGNNGVSTPTYWKGRSAMAGCTDGTLNPAEVAEFYAITNAYLVYPTGR